MTGAINNSININSGSIPDTYLFNQYRVQNIENGTLAEVVREVRDSENISEKEPEQNAFAIEDKYTPKDQEEAKEEFRVTLKERLRQVISPEELQNLLALMMRAPGIMVTTGQVVDVRG